MSENKERVFSNTVINWLACIYDDYHLNPYKMGISKEWDFASFNKKEEKNWKNRLKYTLFWEELGYWLVTCRHLFFKHILYVFFMQ